MVLRNGMGVVLIDGKGGIKRWYGWYYEMSVVLRDSMGGIRRWYGFYIKRSYGCGIKSCMGVV